MLKDKNPLWESDVFEDMNQQESEHVNGGTEQRLVPVSDDSKSPELQGCMTEAQKAACFIFTPFPFSLIFCSAPLCP